MKIAIDFRTPAPAAMWRIAAGVADYAASNQSVQVAFAHSIVGESPSATVTDCDAAIVYAPRADLVVPQVAVSSTAPPGCIRAGVDEARIAEIVVSHFVSMGLQHLAFAGGRMERISDIRWERFSSAARQAGLDPVFLGFGDDLPNQLMRLPKPAGIMVANDAFGRDLMEQCEEAGLRVPGELNLIGVDNLPDPTYSHKTLASVSLPFAHIGYHAARLCADLVNGKSVESILVPPTGIVLGESLTKPGMEMSTAAAVAHFMRMNIGQAIEMEDLVRQSHLSRRRLEQLFRAAHGRAPMAYLKDLRLERAKRLLRNTDDPLREVVKATGYRDVNHLCRIFRQRLGTTPLRYRESGEGTSE